MRKIKYIRKIIKTMQSRKCGIVRSKCRRVPIGRTSKSPCNILTADGSTLIGTHVRGYDRPRNCGREKILSAKLGRALMNAHARRMAASQASSQASSSASSQKKKRRKKKTNLSQKKKGRK